MKFKVGDLATINENSRLGIPKHIGELVKIIANDKTALYDYRIRFQNTGETVPVKEEELTKIEDNDPILEYKVGEIVLYTATNDPCEITQIDYCYRQAAVKFRGGGNRVIGIAKFRKIAHDKVNNYTNSEIDQEETDVGMYKLLLSNYKNKDNTYTVPEILLERLLQELRERW